MMFEVTIQLSEQEWEWLRHWNPDSHISTATEEAMVFSLLSQACPTVVDIVRAVHASVQARGWVERGIAAEYEGLEDISGLEAWQLADVLDTHDPMVRQSGVFS